MKKKVLFMGELKSGGAEHQMVILASALARRDYDVTYLCAGKGSFFEPILNEAGIRLVRFTESKISSLLKLNIPRRTYMTYKFLKKEKFDTVISFLGLWNFENCFFAKCNATKHRAITGLRNCRVDTLLGEKKQFYAKYEKYADLKVSNSDCARTLYAKCFPNYDGKMITIYNAVSLPEINSRYEARRDGKVHIIVPASYRDVKNPFGLIDALCLLDEKCKSLINITWYGDIKSSKAVYGQMVRQISGQGLTDVIELKDSTLDIANRINENDVVALFSKSEGLPNAICEGMMLAKPVLMSRVSDYNVLVDETNGFLCDWDKPETIADALCQVSVLTKTDLTKMGEQSKAKAKRLFSVESIASQWETII